MRRTRMRRTWMRRTLLSDAAVIAAQPPSSIGPALLSDGAEAPLIYELIELIQTADAL
jgi:hypothetical protein